MESGMNARLTVLRRRTSPRPCWIPLAAVDQNYKAEQRFGTSVRDPRRDILHPCSSSSRSPLDRMGFDRFPEHLREILFLASRENFSLARNHWRVGRWGQVAHIACHFRTLASSCSTRKRVGSPRGFSTASWRVRRRVENLFTRRVAHVAHAKNRIGSLGY